MSNQHKKLTTPSDLVGDDLLTHQILAPYAVWLPR